MKTIGAALKAHLAGEVTTIATLWKVTRTDGAVYGFTDHDRALELDGVTYEAASGMTASAVESSASLAVPNGEVEGVLDSSSLNEADLLAGKWDFARVDVFQVNYSDLTQGTLKLRRGWLGEIRTTRGGFTAELRGMMQALQQSIGRIVAPACDADVGDARCGVDLSTFPNGTVATTVTSAASQRVFTASALSQAAGWFNGGKVLFSSGANDGVAMEVKTFAGGVVELVLPMPGAIAPGDAFTITAGCDKTLATCKAKFANAINFRGFPHLPGIDRMISGT
ncbi:MAG: DUF2163 domain-containing protein [Planctomycetes bacterium]|nr:DUF2163 domain-containing protein [Planctomycetota bacterium]